MYIIEKIIGECERSTVDWREGKTGGHHLKVSQADYDRCGKSELIQEAENLVEKGLIEISQWVIRGSDIATIYYRVEDLTKFYELLENERGVKYPRKQELVWQYQKLLDVELQQVQTPWIRDYYKNLLKVINKGNLRNKDLIELIKNKDVYFPCFRGIDELKEPVFKRLFSLKYLHNSKVFENNDKKVQNYIVAKARQYCHDIEEAMSDTEVLSQLFIEEYSQELTLKGPLKLCLEKDGEQVELDSKKYYYGTVLNSETLKHAVIRAKQPDIRRVISIENKANFVSAEYKEDTLYIFTHGYLSPRERDFLKGLEIALMGCDVEFYHSGDLDYGGVKIYEYMKKHIFSRIEPLMMDVDTFEKYISFGEEIGESTLKKLENTKIPEMQLLIDKMVEKKISIEQECFLVCNL